MRYLDIFSKYMVFQVVLVLIGMGHVFGGPAHISGFVHGHSQSTTTHISGRVYSEGDSPTIKTHVSGSKKLLPVQELEPAQSKIIRKARRMGITVGDIEKSIPTQRRGTTQKKLK